MQLLANLENFRSTFFIKLIATIGPLLKILATFWQLFGFILAISEKIFGNLSLVDTPSPQGFVSAGHKTKKVPGNEVVWQRQTFSRSKRLYPGQEIWFMPLFVTARRFSAHPMRSPRHRKRCRGASKCSLGYLFPHAFAVPFLGAILDFAPESIRWFHHVEPVIMPVAVSPAIRVGFWTL